MRFGIEFGIFAAVWEERMQIGEEMAVSVALLEYERQQMWIFEAIPKGYTS